MVAIPGTTIPFQRAHAGVPLIEFLYEIFPLGLPNLAEVLDIEGKEFRRNCLRGHAGGEE